MWISLFLGLAGLLVFLPGAEAGWNFVNSGNVQNKDASPVLGRGFSFYTGMFHSTCLSIGDLDDPTSDYDYYFIEVEGTANKELAFSGKLANSVAFGPINGEMELAQTDETEAELHAHFIIAMMTSDNYFMTVDESIMGFIPPAEVILERGSVMQFYQACGPHFIRSIRRGTEVATLFTYFSLNRESNSDMLGVVQPDVGDTGVARGTKSRSDSAGGLVIKIMAFGLGINAVQEDGGSLVASSMEDFQKVMDTAFTSMQDPYSGMVRSIEVMPWTSTSVFQNAIVLDNALSRNTFGCSDSISACCDPARLSAGHHTSHCTAGIDCGYDSDGNEVYDDAKCVITGSEDVLHKDLRKFNLQQNAEFLATVDRNIQEHMAVVQNHHSCLKKLMALTSEYDDWTVVNKRFLFADPMSVVTLRSRLLYGDGIGVIDPIPTDPESVLPPSGKYLFDRRMELMLSYKTNFVDPCFLELGEVRYNALAGYMQLKHWQEIDACSYVQCTWPGTVWNGSGCQAYDIANLELKDMIYLDYRLDQYCPMEIKVEP
uniref:MACPF domain-containing protein n=1 Tax=Corethron hystrix TaxID=216773 RepID=A0A7S1BD73_9STRA|mmetsp:Transcript_22358/g.51223  ORF Transcript_22358/g.51223 Transcript_22358/m.51223 type:complete len:543 (+) Transcript_22358:279-1907(+)|eukprot:CAMPEP_0113298960 /NCGR_PEP_ID=MMETSP0010_2-20120614/1184_1 /TAXON_ID=216773 ORGANISM="Corethron hystrix, Strain 308" /NCGR_SAMPLE_ID=MMETSP0010_2 /ASSEMBLY_ACC=CAM_ASM_000155 /LENGTH=542 /DNA_ID=CAMNT_0000152095 /DNA_START=135 /DNA_END=1763 /DNA_ORIENTATION=+ /assembly_acc=CAM_ASM_000155